MIPVDKIVVREGHNTRKSFDPKALKRLGKSISANDLIEPLSVRPIDGGMFMLLAGERRLRAAKLEGIKELPGHINTKGNARTIALVENIQREQLNKVEEAEGVEELAKELKLTTNKPSPSGPFDCSSAVSHLLQVGGFANPTMDTTLLVGWGEPGPGQWVTIFVKPYGADAHTFIRFSAGVTPPGERYWGTSGIVAPGKGPGWIGKTSSPLPIWPGSRCGTRRGCDEAGAEIRAAPRLAGRWLACPDCPRPRQGGQFALLRT
jgi:hypothetical protein